MKSERRHELQENELAVALGRINRVIEPYSKLIAFAVAAAFVAVIAFVLYRSRLSENRSDATLQLIQASRTGNAESLAAIAQQYPNTPVAPWARLYQGDAYLAQGMSVLFQDRAEAETMFEQASEAFEAALAKSEHQLIRSRANLGLARIAESRGNTDQAVTAYEAVIAASESESMVEWAERRIEALSSDDTKSFLAWLGEQDFSRPTEPSLPPSLPGMSGLPDVPDMPLPDFSGQSAVPGDQGPDATETDAATAESDPAGDAETANEAADEPEGDTEADSSDASTDGDSPQPTPGPDSNDADDPNSESAEPESAADEAPTDTDGSNPPAVTETDDGTESQSDLEGPQTESQPERLKDATDE